MRGPTPTAAAAVCGNAGKSKSRARSEEPDRPTSSSHDFLVSLCTTMTVDRFPEPKLKSPDALDTLLRERVAKRDLPAIFLGATNADETIYLNQAGERVFGNAAAGEVNEDTRESPRGRA